MTLNILNFTPEELKKKFSEMSFEPYRAEQVLGWIYGKGVYDFDRMTNLSASLREKLKKEFSILIPEVVERQCSEDDKSIKLLLKMSNNDTVETVYIPKDDRQTVCVSSQAGCKFHCAFCASGQAGFFRNLTAGEIISQVLAAREVSPNKKLTNIVFMGIGEPFDNYNELLRTIRTLNSKHGLGMGARRITISTCGLVPKIAALGEEGLQVELSVSLHGANDTVRGALMPVNNAHPIQGLIEACKKYVKKTKRAITFEYILIKGVNASEKDARGLAKLLKGMFAKERGESVRARRTNPPKPYGGLCKVNLIPYNPIREFPHEAPTYPEVVSFQRILQEAGVKATVRFSKGQDIQAACGQLRSTRHPEER